MKYSRSLDYILAAVMFARDRKDTVKAAKAFKLALASPDLEQTCASLERIQSVLQKREVAKASLEEARRKKSVAKPKKKRPQARADFSEDEFDGVLDEMTEATAEADEDTDLDLDDIEEDLEMPEATAAEEDEDDEKEEKDEDEEEDASDMDTTDDLEVNIEGDGEGVTSKRKAKAKATARAVSNVNALKRLQQKR